MPGFLQSVNPTTDEVVGVYDLQSSSEITGILNRARLSFDSWRKATNRDKILHIAGSILREEKERLARLMTVEMGKPIREAVAEVEKCAGTCDFYAANAEAWLKPEDRSDWSPSEFRRSLVRFDPLGTILAIMPWNFPFWQVIRCAVPALSAGNVVLLKHAPNVSGCALAIEDVFHRAGIPPDAFRSLLLPHSRIEEVLPEVAGIALTGSETAGRRIASLAGQHLKKTVMELGGSDPFIVCSDADLPLAAATAARARCVNSGQSCIAAKRFVIESSVYRDFVDLFRVQMQAFTHGNPLDMQTPLGPLARKDLRSGLHDLVEDARTKGGRVLLGGEIVPGPGCFYPATILDNISDNMLIASREAFGPVAAVYKAADMDDAIRISNASPFGLGASIFTADAERAMAMAAELETGNVFVNAAVRSDPSMPFGGVKNSGYGRELSIEGLREFVNVKAVRVG